MALKRLPLIMFALLSLLVTGAFAQTHTFSFGPLSGGGAQFTLIDGQPANCGAGFCGSVQVRGLPGGSVWWGLEAPQVWGFPNNGFLTNNTVTPDPGQLIWDNPGCTDQIAGCTAHSDTTVPLSGYGAGVTVNVHATFIVTAHKCTRFCDNDPDDIRYTTDSTGGTGTATFGTAQAAVHSLYKCGSDRRECLIADGTGPVCPHGLPNCKP